ncbi:MAG: hypothetical protein KTR25_00480 [Myxococcales bacterium]|nr:hypothetical protein [Myxococcales bacterium]
MRGYRQEIAKQASARWSPRRTSIAPQAFTCGQVGPYRLGPELRHGAFGPVNLAIGKEFEFVLEIERIEVPSCDSGCAPGVGSLAARILERMNHCVGCKHPHVASLIGAGLADDEPYILRPHILSRTLDELAADHMLPPPGPVAAGILYSVAEGLQSLENYGPQPGLCLPGGIDGQHILVGWDGSIRVLGAGFALLRDERLGVDLRALISLAHRIEPSLAKIIQTAASFTEMAQQIRRRCRSACAERQELVGSWMRKIDGEGCDALRRLFCMEPLQ